MKRLLEFKKIFIASCSNAILCLLENEHILCPENISALESRNKSPQFRLIKRTSRAIYNLQSFVCFVLIYMNDVFFRFGCLRFFRGFATTAHRINKLFLLVVSENSFYAYEIWLLEIYKFLIQHRKAKQKNVKSNANRHEIA